MEAATALANGDTEGMFAAMKKHSASAEKAMRAQLLKEAPTPPPGDGGDAHAAMIANMRAAVGLSND